MEPIVTYTTTRGRLMTEAWLENATNVNVIRTGYDTERRITTASATPVAYVYDGLHRLEDMRRGDLNANKDGITGRTFAEDWDLDPTGNWSGFQSDDNGDGTWDLVQNRTANPVNEITGITETTGPSWVTPAYDPNGNMTTLPRPDAPASGYSAVYDAWNRLVKLNDGTNTVQENEYDGQRYRIVRKDYAGGTLDETRRFYYTNQWQSIEERIGSSTVAERQAVWGIRYIDDLVLRNRDTTGNGILDERLYALQDANWNVVALADSFGTIQERFAYSAYGTPLFLSAGFVPIAGSSFEWDVLYCGYRIDPGGLYCVRNRFLHAELGMWLVRDFAAYVDGLNLYAYVGNDPVNLLDGQGVQKYRADIVAKSFINGLPIIGSLPAFRVGLPDPPSILQTFNPGPVPIGIKSNATARLNFLAGIVGKYPPFNAAFNENPWTDIKDGKYRLYTRADIAFCCDGSRITFPKVASTDMEGGVEVAALGIEGTIHMSKVTIKRTSLSSIEVSWLGWGRPNSLVEPGMQWVAYRTSVNIWHGPTVILSCNNNGQGTHKVKSFAGSRFPSRRLWINGTLESNKRQGAFSDLWHHQPGNPTFVR